MSDLRAEVLRAEAQWLRKAHAASADKGYSPEFRAGFAAAAGWVDFHADPVEWASRAIQRAAEDGEIKA